MSNPYRAAIPDEPCPHTNNALPREGAVPRPDSWYLCHDCGQRVARRAGGLITVAQNNAHAHNARSEVRAWDEGYAQALKDVEAAVADATRLHVNVCEDCGTPFHSHMMDPPPIHAPGCAEDYERSIAVEFVDAAAVRAVREKGDKP